MANERTKGEKGMFKNNRSEIVLIFTIALLIFSTIISISLDIQHRETIKIYEETIELYEEYYVLDKDMDLLHKQWVEFYQSYDEEEYYLRFHTKEYLRYLELKKIIGEIKE